LRVILDKRLEGREDELIEGGEKIPTSRHQGNM